MAQAIQKSRRLQGLAAIPLAFGLLAAMVLAITNFQDPAPAQAGSAPYERIFAGTARARFKDGNIWKVVEIPTCVLVLTDGPEGKIINTAVISGEELLGSDSEECFEVDPRLTAASVFGPDEPGLTVAVTLYDAGWKAPVASGKNAATFAVATPSFFGGAADNRGYSRLFNANTKLFVKFIRERQGVYFKINGFLGPAFNPGNATLPAKVAFEFEAMGGGFDSPPRLTAPVSYNGCEWSCAPLSDSDTSDDVEYVELDYLSRSFPLTFSEQVSVSADPEIAPFLYCYDDGLAVILPVAISGTGATRTVSVSLGHFSQFEWNTSEDHIHCDLVVTDVSVTDTDLLDGPDHMASTRFIPVLLHLTDDGCICAVRTDPLPDA